MNTLKLFLRNIYIYIYINKYKYFSSSSICFNGIISQNMASYCSVLNIRLHISVFILRSGTPCARVRKMPLGDSSHPFFILLLRLKQP